MQLLDLINQIWHHFLNLFPEQYQALVTSVILIGIIVSFISLFMFNPLFFIIALIIFLPILYPIIVTFLTEVNEFLKIIVSKSNTQAYLFWYHLN
jgi:hypothetical protein